MCIYTHICIFCDPLYMELYLVCSCCKCVSPNQNHSVLFKCIGTKSSILKNQHNPLQAEHGFLAFSTSRSVSVAAISPRACLMDPLKRVFFPLALIIILCWSWKALLFSFCAASSNHSQTCSRWYKWTDLRVFHVICIHNHTPHIQDRGSKNTRGWCPSRVFPFPQGLHPTANQLLKPIDFFFYDALGIFLPVLLSLPWRLHDLLPR